VPEVFGREGGLDGELQTRARGGEVAVGRDARPYLSGAEVGGRPETASPATGAYSAERGGRLYLPFEQCCCSTAER